jgi:predicted flap endonuclease-1-like 5' DNA nuclease
MLGTVIATIILCLIVAFALGFAIAWLLRNNYWSAKVRELEASLRTREFEITPTPEEAADTAELLRLRERSAEQEQELGQLRSDVRKSARPAPAVKKSKPKKPARKPQRPVATKDDLKMIPGIGPTLERMLNRNGVRTYRQIASWKDRDVQKFDQKLNFHGRIRRDRWVTRARQEHWKKYRKRLK